MKPKNTIKRVLFVFFLTTTLSACASKPREVVAERPLVAQSFVDISGEKIPSRYWEQLNQANVTTIVHPQYHQISLGKPYISALGTQCRKIYIQYGKQGRTQVACAVVDGLSSDTNEWRLMPVLESGVKTIAL